MDDSWAQNGIANATYNEAHDTMCPTSCELHHGHPGLNDELVETGFGCGGKEHLNCNDPDDDIERRINLSIENTLGDILSDVVNRCISSSLKGCIEV